jgi:phosphatidate cytidylyltransferase
MARAPARNAAGQPVARVVGARWRDLAPRVASAMALAPIALFAVWRGGIVWQGLLTLLATIAVLEWVTLCSVKLDNVLTVAAASSVPAAQAAYLATGRKTILVAVIAAFAAVLAWRHRLLGAGVLYIGAGYLGLLLVRVGPGGLANLVFLLLVVWANDIGAYLAGRLIGGRRMAPRLSPGKTWAGAGGGMVFSVVAGLAVAAWFGADRGGQFRAEGIAVILSVLAQAGDLAESALKRRTGRKDSGNLIPGHGGILDRVDGLLAASIGALAWQVVMQFIWPQIGQGALLWQ